MPRQPEPLNIPFFATGLYTYRSHLFSPYRSVGINVVTYHDAVIDGQNMELSNRLQWRRRPGFTRYCSVPFAAGEIPNQFYSVRQPAGTVVDFVDTNQNFSTFTPTSLTPIIVKSTTNQGFIQQVGGMTYYADGVDMLKWNGTNVSNWGTAAPTIAPNLGQLTSSVSFWQPNYNFNSWPATIGPVIVDSNGNFEYGALGNVTTGSSVPVWPAGLAQTVVDGNTKWLNCGPYTGWSPSTAYVFAQMITDSNGNLQFCQTGGTSGGSAPSWATTVGATTTDNGVTWISKGPLLSGTLKQSGTPTIQYGYVYGYCFRTVYGELSTCSPLSTTTGPGIGPFQIQVFGQNPVDTQCFQDLTIVSIAIDANQNLTVTYNPASVSLQNVAAGQNYTLSGLSAATFLNGQVVTVASVGTNSFTAIFNHAQYGPASDTGTANFNSVELYRTDDGGGLLFFMTSFPPNTQVIDHIIQPWSYIDTNPDNVLLQNLIAPISHLNDPPPGTTGSLVTQAGTILAYWQGRIWMVVGNKVYFDAGPDCTNGVPESSWPPANVFQYPGPILGLNPTSQGLLVWGSDYVSMVLGGPQTLSFFPWDLLKNFGISSVNAISQDGDSIYVLTTQGEAYLLNDTGKEDFGNYIADLLELFPNTSAYVTMHRQGRDAGVYVCDGQSTIYRYSLNINSWSTAGVVVGGVGAIKSIETSPGVMTLCAGRATGGGYILGRNLTQYQDDGQNYPLCYVTVGNITLAPPGFPAAPLHHVIGYFDAAGTLGPQIVKNSQGFWQYNQQSVGGPSLPNLQILPNENDSSSGIGFINVPGINMEPPVGQTSVSSTIMALDWPINSIDATAMSMYVHHLQVKISFAPENAGNTIKSLTLKPFPD
jgi:hypothetical protein